ncbi:hypothetical protein ACIGO9_31750 [Nocardia asteroides]|uniref:hypothetical protein n=1 Tax=Nocardia asteroides TaxID=1824 RepID=UPI0037C69419
MIVSKWTAAHVLALREYALREDREEFAARLGFSAKVVDKWERTATKENPVRGASARALDTALERLSGNQLARMRMAPGIEDDVNRRQFGFGATTLVGASLAVDTVTAGSHSGTGPRIGLTDVRALVDYTEALEQRDQREGGAALVVEASAVLAVTRQQLDSAVYDPITGTAAASAVGNLAVITGFLAYDADDQDFARQCYSAAMELGSRSGDDELTVHTLCNKANQEVTLSRHGRGNAHLALQNAARAWHLARDWRPGRIHALISVREAQARAAIGDHDGFRTAMDKAHRALDAAMHAELITHCPRWLRFVDPGELAGHEARAYSDLGDHRAALKLYELATRGQGRRNETNASAWHAATRAAVGDVRGALEVADPVLSAMEGTAGGRPPIGSTRSLRVLAPIGQLAGAGDTFIDRYNALDSKKAITA